MTKPSESIELAIGILRDIERRAPGTKEFVDYDAFIMNELNPALVVARNLEGQTITDAMLAAMVSAHKPQEMSKGRAEILLRAAVNAANSY